MHISLAFLDAGDEVLIPNPGYPTYTSVSKIVGAKPKYYELSESNSWLPNLEKLKKMNLSKVKIMWVNYPNMPTGSNCSLSFFNDLILCFSRVSSQSCPCLHGNLRCMLSPSCIIYNLSNHIKFIINEGFSYLIFVINQCIEKHVLHEIPDNQ